MLVSGALKRMAGEDVFGRKISTRYAGTSGAAYSSDEGYCTAQQTHAQQQQTAWSLALQQLPAPPMVSAPPAACLPPPEPQAPRRIRGTHGSASMDRSWCSSSTSTSTSTCSEGGWEEVGGEGSELTVSGLPTLSPTVLRARLIELFSNVVPVRSVRVASTPDGPQATVMLRSLNDARLVIARIHKRRLDNQWNGRRLELSLGRAGTATSADTLRARLRAILLEQRGHILPLLRLRDAYAGRHATALTAADLLRVQDTVVVHEGLGRLVQLVDLRPVSPAEAEEAPWRCARHANPALSAAQPEDGSRLLTHVYMELEVLAARTHVLLTEHGGVLPLLSFMECYEATFGPMYADLDRGVPLELMLRSIPSVQVKEFPSRHVCWPEADSSPNQSARSESSRWSGSGEREKARTAPALEPLLALFERELVDLLRTSPRCTIPFGKLIPAFHHHFGRQCRVADYGFTKLPDLLNALSSTVVVLGSGSSRVITLTSAAQGRRWTNDLVKLLKAHVGRKVTGHDIPELYQLTFGRNFRPVDYGACTIIELMARLTPQSVFVNPEDGAMSLPRRIPTSEELARTAQFAVQTVELLCYTPNLRMEFSRFVPAYNAHFGHQLRVAHYGCVKLFDLFELISDAVTVHAEGGERSVRLAQKTARLVVAQRLRALGVLPLNTLPAAYAAQYGAQPLPDMLLSRSLIELVYAAGGCVQHEVLQPPGHAPHWVVHMLGACAVLANDRSVAARGSSDEYFHTNFRKLCGATADEEGLVAAGVVVIQDRCFRLTSTWRTVWRISQILAESQTPTSAMDVFIKYKSIYETPSEIRFEEVSDMLREYGEVFTAATDGWTLADGILVPRYRELLPAEDYSMHDTPPGEKGSRVFETPRLRKWCSPPASALPSPSALLQHDKRRTRLAAHFEDI